MTGAPAVQHDLSPVLAADLRTGELVAVLTALVFLSFALGLSPAVLLPFAVALCTITSALAIVYALAHEFLMVLYVPNLVELIGLGLAIDYSLLIVHRFRQELADDARPVDDAIVSTMATAGRTVVVSGVAVAFGLSVLLIVPVPFVRSLGLAAFVVPSRQLSPRSLCSQPCCRSWAAEGRTALACPGSVRGDTTSAACGGGSRIWSWADPVPLSLARQPSSSPATVPVAWLQLTPASVTAIPRDTQSDRGLALSRGAGRAGVMRR